MKSFENTDVAFAYKSTGKLKKAAFLFKIMGKPFFVNLGLKFTPWAIKMRLPFTNTLIKKTIFQQFVGGETLQETALVAETLGKYGVDVILDYGVEGGDENAAGFEHAADEFIRVISYAATQPNIPFI
ncbi:MAG: proline dehydrogenase, partial [Ferruginibacter sp.]